MDANDNTQGIYKRLIDDIRKAFWCMARMEQFGKMYETLVN